MSFSEKTYDHFYCVV